jgi:hypothetical protein
VVDSLQRPRPWLRDIVDINLSPPGGEKLLRAVGDRIVDGLMLRGDGEALMKDSGLSCSRKRNDAWLSMQA